MISIRHRKSISIVLETLVDHDLNNSICASILYIQNRDVAKQKHQETA